MADNSLTRPPTEEELEIMRRENSKRQYDADSVFNDYLAGRSYQGMDDPFMHYMDALEGRHGFQNHDVTKPGEPYRTAPRSRQELDPVTREHLQNYMEQRRQLHRKQFKPPTHTG